MATHSNTFSLTSPLSGAGLQRATATENCNILKYTALRCNTRQRTATHYTTLQHSVVQVFKGLWQQKIATHGSTRQHIATHCNTLQHTATHCNTPQHTATLGRASIHRDMARANRNTLRHTATRCYTLQHTATHHGTARTERRASHLRTSTP